MSTFWGLEINPGKTYAQTVPESFRVTMAALGTEIKNNKRTSLVVKVDDNAFVLCSLTPEKVEQQTLDVVFSEGEEITFSVVGDNTIFLTGNYVPDEPEEDMPYGYGMMGEDSDEDMEDISEDEMDAMEALEDDSEEEESDEDEEEAPEVKMLSKAQIKKMQKEPKIVEIKDAENENKNAKAKQQAQEKKNENSAKKEEVKEEKPKNTPAKAAPQKQNKTPANAEKVEVKVEAEQQQQNKKRPNENAATPANNNKKAKIEENKKQTPAPKQEEPQQQQKTPAAENKKQEQKTPATENKKQEQKTPATENKKQEQKTPAAENKKQEQKTPATEKKGESNAETPGTAKKKTLPSGLTIEDGVLGKGPKAKQGKKVSVRYIGKLQNGKTFDSNTSGKPFTFQLGKGEVIKGWDMGVQGMNVGGTRKLIIPANLAYGAKGAPPAIPANATLTFEIKLLGVE